MGEYQIRGYQTGDELKIIELYKLVFGRPLSLAEWEWRFVKNPYGQKMISLMWDGELLIGHYAVSPVEVIIEGKPILTALSLSTMTHPEYTGQGVFKELALQLYNDCRQEYGVHFVWGFPNDNSHYGFIKNLNWIDIGVVPNFRSNAIQIGNIPKFSIVKRFSPIHEESANLFYDSAETRVNKTAAYLNWRYCENPTREYTIVELEGADQAKGFAVYKPYLNNGKKEIDIVELICETNAQVIQDLLSSIMIVENNSVESINMWCSLNDKKHIVLEKMGFKNSGHITYFAALKDIENYGMAKELMTWNLSFGDSDVY